MKQNNNSCLLILLTGVLLSIGLIFLVGTISYDYNSNKANTLGVMINIFIICATLIPAGVLIFKYKVFSSNSTKAEKPVSLFGAKPNIAFVVIIYDGEPPSNAKQEELLSTISKKYKLRAKLIGTQKFDKEHQWPLELICARWIAETNQTFKGDYKINSDIFGSFTAATIIGYIDYDPFS